MKRKAKIWDGKKPTNSKKPMKGWLEFRTFGNSTYVYYRFWRGKRKPSIYLGKKV